ncbi:hypothetical protein XENOCAPTIV_017901 [Xenoophorus captivus]|uniref:Uncharacterized protein n=1 Tax=Xenoophorus captivus TaxID=1517983 RepID=A0ABV0RHV7_9TELE
MASGHGSGLRQKTLLTKKNTKPCLMLARKNISMIPKPFGRNFCGPERRKWNFLLHPVINIEYHSNSQTWWWQCDGLGQLYLKTLWHLLLPRVTHQYSIFPSVIIYICSGYLSVKLEFVHTAVTKKQKLKKYVVPCLLQVRY